MREELIYWYIEQATLYPNAKDNLEEYSKLRNDLREKVGERKMRSATAILNKAKVYIPKPKTTKSNPLDQYEEDNLTESYGHASLVLNDKLEKVSKDRIIALLETRLELPAGSLFSLRSAHRLAVTALISAIADAAKGLIDPELETLVEEATENKRPKL